MTSLAMLNGAEQLMTSYLVATSTNNYMLHNSPPTSSEHSPPPTNSHRILPKISNHHQYNNNNSSNHHHHNQESVDLLRCKRRIQLGHLPPSGKGTGPQPAAVARRNERERNRVRLVNMGFATLRQHVPNSSKNKKMSKVDTLKSAVEYIKRLQELLGETTSEGSMSGLDENSYPIGGQSSTGSPNPSVCSDASSPYGETIHGDEDDDLMEFASWF